MNWVCLAVLVHLSKSSVVDYTVHACWQTGCVSMMTLTLLLVNQVSSTVCLQGFTGHKEGTLDALFAQRDHTQLTSTAGGPDSGMMAKVQSLQAQLKQVAAAAVAAGKPIASKAAFATSKAATATSKAAGDAANATVNRVTAAVKNVSLSKKLASDEDVSAPRAPVPHSGPRPQPRVSKQQEPSYPIYADPESAWMVADDHAQGIRHIVVHAPESLARQSRLPSTDLTTFETYSLGTKINKHLYTEASALYNRFMPLVLDFLQENPTGKVALSGEGLGGSLATILVLMLVHRGLRRDALAPVYALNAPAVLCEVPDFKQWCSKDGCSMEDMGAMIEDLMTRGVLSELGLSQDVVRNVFYQQVPGSTSHKQDAGKLEVIHSWDTTALQQSPLVPDVLKAWLRSEGKNSRNLQILNPVGRVMLYAHQQRSTGC